MGRTITIKKADLIEKIKENKINHVADYVEAVAADYVEAKRQLEEQLLKLEKGNLQIKLNLVVPSNKSDEYDKILKMFEWEQKDMVELSQSEFNEYILDEAQFAIHSKMLNSTYRG